MASFLPRKVPLLLHMHMHGRSWGNVMILRARIRLSRISFLTSLSLWLSLLSAPLLRPLSNFFSPVREIKQLKSAFVIRKKKQRRVSVYLRLFYRGALRYTWDLAVFLSFFPSRTDRCVLVKVFRSEFCQCLMSHIVV